MGWFEDREELERRWGRWRARVKSRGLALAVELPLDTNWIGIEKKFPIRYTDRLGASHQVDVRKALLRLGPAEVATLARRLAARVPIGDCARCGKRAILELSLERKQCRRCVVKSIAEWSEEERRCRAAERAARIRIYVAKGHRWLVELWIHPRSGGDDYFLELPFRTKPTRAQVRAIAAKRRSALGDDWRVERIRG